VAPRTRPAPLRLLSRYGAARDANAIVRGDNLDVLARLHPEWTERFRVVYVDPPYNTGRTFKEYRDARSPADWRAMMCARLALLPALLAKNGTLVAEIDDTELGSLLTLLDEIFGRENRVSIVTVVRSAPTGHKAKNRGPVNVADYLLVYAKDKRAFSPNPGVRRREGRDPAYSTVLEDPAAPPNEWQFKPLGRAVAESLGFASRLAAVRALGREAFEAKVDRFCLDHPERVVRFAQPRYEAVSNEARAAIDRSRAAPSEVFILERRGFRPLILRGGNRLLILADKVRTIEGERCFVEPLTNVWDDVPFQGLAREGGVTFSRNKKPERLIGRILELFSDEGDWVLDPFLGSGTTAAVAHRMSRRYVGVESSAMLVGDLCIPRLERVVDNEGGGFGVYA
jgi:adenine-specific DNA-methyltransferase